MLAIIRRQPSEQLLYRKFSAVKMQHTTYWALTVFHSLLHNYVTNNSKNVCKAAHNFLAKRMPTNQRKALKRTLRGGLKFVLTTLRLQSSHAMLYSWRFQCTGKIQTTQEDGRVSASHPLWEEQSSLQILGQRFLSCLLASIQPEQETSLDFLLGSPVKFTNL